MTATEVKRRLNESVAHLGAARKMWEQAKEDHETRVAHVQATCEHGETRLEYAQYEPATTVCNWCGAELD